MVELCGGTRLVLGLGSIGTEVASLPTALGMRTLAINRRGASDSPQVDEARRVVAAGVRRALRSPGGYREVH